MTRTQPRCTSPRCKVDPETGVLIPRPAASGLQLCEICARILAEDVLVVAVRDRQLGLVLVATGQAGQRVGGGERDANIRLNLRAAALRRDIRHALTALTKLITAQRGFAWPTDRLTAARPAGFIGPLPLVAHRTDRIPPLARFVARNAEWLAAHDRADEHAALLRELAVGQSYRVAFPTGVRRFVLPGMAGDQYLACPETVDDDEPCPGVLWTILRRDGDRLPSQLMCNHDEHHQWPTSQWVKLGRRMLRIVETRRQGDADPPAATGSQWRTVEQITLGTGLPAGTVWRLAHQHRWRKRDQGKPACYAAEDVDATLQAREDRRLAS